MNVKSRMRRKLDALGFDFRTFTLDSFVAWLEATCGRRIIYIPLALPATLHGAWFTDAELPIEYIFFDNSVPAIHQTHTQLHELCHVINGHKTVALTSEKLRKLILYLREAKGLPDDLSQILFRSPYSHIEEQEAETLATLIHERVIQHARLAELTRVLSSSPETAAFLRDMGVD